MLSYLFFSVNLIGLTILAKNFKSINQHKGLSLLNSILLGFGSMIYFVVDDYIDRPEEINDGKLKFYPLILYLHTFGVSYCIVDMNCNWDKIDFYGRIHHFIMAITLSIVVAFDLLKPAFLFFPIEISTVFLNMRSMFKENTYPRDQATFFFVLSFICLRLIYLPYVDYIVYLYFIKGLYLHLVYFLSVVPMQILQFYWLYYMVDKYVVGNKKRIKYN